MTDARHKVGMALTFIAAHQAYLLAITLLFSVCSLHDQIAQAADPRKGDVHIGKPSDDFRHETIKARFRMEGIEKRLRGVEDNLTAFKTDLTNVRKEMDGPKPRLEALEKQYKGVEDNLAASKTNLADIGKEIGDVKHRLDNVSILGPVLQVGSILVAAFFAVLAWWYTMHLKIGDMTLHCFAAYREFDGDKGVKDERKAHHWWGHQHLQFTFWRRGLISNSTFHSWMLRRRLEDWCERRSGKTTGLHNWDEEKYAFQMTDFSQFMDNILVNPSNVQDTLTLQTESDLVRNVMERHRLKLQKFLSVIQIVGKEMTLPPHAMNLIVRFQNGRYSLSNPSEVAPFV